MADDDDTPCSGHDKMHVGPDIGGGTHPYIRHRPDHSLETGFFTEHAPKDDVAAPKGLVRLTQSGPGVYDVEALGAASGRPAGPAKVATPAYRSGWDRIFGASKTVGQA